MPNKINHFLFWGFTKLWMESYETLKMAKRPTK